MRLLVILLICACPSLMKAESMKTRNLQRVRMKVPARRVRARVPVLVELAAAVLLRKYHRT